MLDRTQAPAIRMDSPVALPESDRFLLGRQPVVGIGGAAQAITKMEWVFTAGKWCEEKKGAAHFTAKMLKEGTTQRDAQAIAHQLDYWGASLSAESTADYWTLTAYCLTRHFPDMIRLIRELLTEATFPEAELALKKHLMKQKLRVNLQKVGFQATRKLMGSLFGPDHYYGYRLQEADIDAITTADLHHFYQTHIAHQPVHLFISGQYPDDFPAVIASQWPELLDLPAPNLRPNTPLHMDYTPGDHYIPVPQAQQSALRMGKLMPHHTHPDYQPLKVLNTVLGGYFGSRLMSNIREDKGYTYGIYSVLHAYAQQAIFYISTEVGADHEAAARQEIHKEIEQLQRTPIPEDELTLVRHYLLGNIMGSIDGPMKAANTIKGLLLQGRDEQDFNDFIAMLRTVTPDQLQALAQQYWKQDSFIEVVAGPNQQA
mgnify:CR=1 FL=1